jgi:hypothetical protein
MPLISTLSVGAKQHDSAEKNIDWSYTEKPKSVAPTENMGCAPTDRKRFSEQILTEKFTVPKVVETTDKIGCDHKPNFPVAQQVFLFRCTM